ncbi:DUF6069 family protein [Dactylosporangium sp. CA-233914]|uniref:DUF6069 family protein n=1 Tax=Dactylosporangium sp. CA-233914 TaxID=3239934 RepID=UPI003D925A07
MRSPLKRAGIVAGAVVAAEAVYLIVHNAAGVGLTVAGQGPVGAVAAGATAALAGLLGWALLEILERVTSRGRVIWIVAAALVLLVSLAGPLGADTGGAVAGLAALHLTVGAVLLAGLPR